MIERKGARCCVRSFSLIEIVVAVSIMALCAGIATPFVINHVKTGYKNKTKAELGVLSNAVESFYLDTRGYPKSLKELLVTNGTPKWNGPYLKQRTLPKDGWNNDYVYELKNGTFVIISYGEDGEPGGTGYATDLYSDNLNAEPN